MFKISHELPINMLNQSYEINDYEYCLPHLLDKNETYKNHFYQAKKDGRYIVMDNSLHELGKTYSEDRLFHWVEKLEPNEFIVPDVWQNKTSTLVNAKRWSKIELPENTTKYELSYSNRFPFGYLTSTLYFNWLIWYLLCGISYHTIILVIRRFVITLYNITKSFQLVKLFLCSIKYSFSLALARRIAHLCCFNTLTFMPPVYQTQLSIKIQYQILSVINIIKTFN